MKKADSKKKKWSGAPASCSLQKLLMQIQDCTNGDLTSKLFNLKFLQACISLAIDFWAAYILSLAFPCHLWILVQQVADSVFCTPPPILRLKSGKSASSSNSASQVRRKRQIQILELGGFSIKNCRQQTLIGRHSGKNMGKGASSSSSERVIATSVSTFPKGKSNTCPAGRLSKSI